MKRYLFYISFFACAFAKGQVNVDLSGVNKNGNVKAVVDNSILHVSWPISGKDKAAININLIDEKPLFKNLQVSRFGKFEEIGVDCNPEFLLTVGKRDLVSQNGWNIFFDKPNKRPHTTHRVNLAKKWVKVSTYGNRTLIRIGTVNAAEFTGNLEITLYNGIALFNVAAVMSTTVDSTAILYDAGLMSRSESWKNIAWVNMANELKSGNIGASDSATSLAVKYRTVVGVSGKGCLAIFPAPHQYFYPLDEAFNLKFTWFGNNYRDMLPGFGFGIRQELDGDHRYVPWFNAPPGTQQRLNFFCLFTPGTSKDALDQVKRFTHNDTYKPLAGYKTMSSHFHNEYVMNVALKSKTLPDRPSFVNVFKNAGINIVHLAEFHYTAHPKGPDEQRLQELKSLFSVCEKYSDNNFLLLPGEEPNEFFGGHWLAFFPKPVYWIMARETAAPFVKEDPDYGKVYRIGNKEDMLRLLQAENGLAWTAHARTKGSTGFPDKYKEEGFFKSDHFFGAAWKALPADLSQPRLGRRALDLLDDMANWGLKKHMIAEADLFTVEPENEMYAHLNVNYLQLDELPVYQNGWQPVLDVMQKGKFFVTTGEVLIPKFEVHGKHAGESLKAPANGKVNIHLEADWTFPLNFAEIITGDGEKVYRERINLDSTLPFGKQIFNFTTDITNKKWLRVELWDVAANGAFTQHVWIE